MQINKKENKKTKKTKNKAMYFIVLLIWYSVSTTLFSDNTVKKSLFLIAWYSLIQSQLLYRALQGGLY